MTSGTTWAASAWRGLPAVAVLLLLTGAACSVALRNALAPTPTPVVQVVTPDQIASAMRQDAFYADYADAGPTTLRLTGTVAAVRRPPRDLQVQLRTHVPATVWCDLGASTATVTTGATITVEAPAWPAQRQADGVLLVQCQLTTAP